MDSRPFMVRLRWVAPQRNARHCAVKTIIAGSTGASEAELDRAEFLGTEILRLVNGRHRKAEVMVKAARDRERAYTLRVRIYNEVRLAVLFVLRKQADVDRASH